MVLRSSPLNQPSHIKPKIHQIYTFDDVRLAFDAHLARYFAFGLAAERDEIVNGDHLCTNKSILLSPSSQ